MFDSQSGFFVHFLWPPKTSYGLKVSPHKKFSSFRSSRASIQNSLAGSECNGRKTSIKNGQQHLMKAEQVRNNTNTAMPLGPFVSFFHFQVHYVEIRYYLLHIKLLMMASSVNSTGRINSKISLWTPFVFITICS